MYELGGRPGRNILLCEIGKAQDDQGEPLPGEGEPLPGDVRESLVSFMQYQRNIDYAGDLSTAMLQRIFVDPRTLMVKYSMHKDPWHAALLN